MQDLKIMAAIALFFLSTITQAQSDPTPVFVAPVKQVKFVDRIEALGTLQANENVNLVSNVTERVTAIYFEDNQRVNKGDILVEMETSEEEAELIEEQFRRDEAQRQVNRLRPLVERGAASTSALDQQERELNASTARINAIQSRINERRIIAPFDGVLGIRNISVGALALPGQGQNGTLITTIDDDSVMKLDFSIPEVFISSLKPGITIEARATAYPEKVFSGTVSSVNSRVNVNTRSVMARAILANDEGLLKAGMLMRIKLNKNPRQSLVIPEEAVVTVGEENAVMLIQSGEQTTVQRQVIEIGERHRGEVEVLSGLTEGQQVVTHGILRIRPGQAVSIEAIETNNERLTDMLNQNTGLENQ